MDMRTNFLILMLLLLVSTNSLAQKLSMNDLLSLQENRTVRANEFLNNKGWSLIRTNKQDSGWLEMMWEKESGGIASAVLMHIHKGDLVDLVRITYITQSREVFNTLKSSLPSDFEYEESTAKQGLTCSNYTNGNEVLLYCNVAKSVQGKEAFAVTIMSYADYAIAYRDENEVF